MATSELRRVWLHMLAAALGLLELMSPAHAQDTAAPGRQIILQQAAGGRLIGLQAEVAAPAMAARSGPAGRDPAMTGQLDPSWLVARPAGMPATSERVADEEEREDSGAYAELGETRFSEVVEEDLAPGARREVTIDASASSVLLGSVQWTGSADPLQLTLSLNGARLADGVGARGGDDRGRVTAAALATAAGRATLAVANPTGNSVRMQLVLGELPE